MSNIKCGNCSGSHSSVAEVKACYTDTTTTTTTTTTKPARCIPGARCTCPKEYATCMYVTAAKAKGEDPFGEPVEAPKATEKQLAFITKLAEERGKVVDLETVKAKTQASRIIAELLAMPKAVRTVKGQRVDEPADGIYVDKDEDGNDHIFKVYKMVHGSGRQGVKRLVKTVHVGGALDGSPKGTFVYMGLAAKHLPASARKLGLEEAKAFGRIYGFCVKCGATLTDDNSIAAGIGPVCAGKGW